MNWLRYRKEAIIKKLFLFLMLGMLISCSKEVAVTQNSVQNFNMIFQGPGNSPQECVKWFKQLEQEAYADGIFYGERCMNITVQLSSGEKFRKCNPTLTINIDEVGPSVIIPTNQSDINSIWWDSSILIDIWAPSEYRAKNRYTGYFLCNQDFFDFAIKRAFEQGRNKAIRSFGLDKYIEASTIIGEESTEQSIQETKQTFLYDDVQTYQESASQAEVKQEITVDDVERLIKATPAFKELPTDALLGIQFVDENWKPTQQQFTIHGDGTVSEGLANTIEGVMLIGSWYIDEIKTYPELCSLAKKIKSDGNWVIKSNIADVTALIKYRNLLKYRSCLGL